jgi:hypothetical protein
MWLLQVRSMKKRERSAPVLKQVFKQSLKLENATSAFMKPERGTKPELLP